MVPYKANQINEHGVFPSLCVWVRQQGAWKLHPYNSIGQTCFSSFIQIFAHSAESLEYFVKFCSHDIQWQC